MPTPYSTCLAHISHATAVCAKLRAMCKLMAIYLYFTESLQWLVARKQNFPQTVFNKDCLNFKAWTVKENVALHLKPHDNKYVNNVRYAKEIQFSNQNC
jgi:hypothetical protein